MSLFGGKKHHRYKNLKRYQHIVGVLIKNGFYEFVYNSNLLQFARFRKKYLPGRKHTRESETPKLSHWERIRLVLEELGPAYIKLGQFLSNRSDILPKKLCEELEKLLDSATPFAAEEATRILEEDLHAGHESLFASFDKDPISSASIAQVHVARLRDGSKLAVKIQRPNIKEIIETDLEIMADIAAIMEKFSEDFAALHPVEIIEDFQGEIANELDFRIEASNIEKFRNFFQDDSRTRVPLVHKSLSSQRVLTMEYLEGVKLSHIHDIAEAPGLDAQVITDSIANLILRQFFEVGFFHADPHAGNIIIMEGNVVAFIDFGLVGILPPKHKEMLCDIISGLVTHDHEKISSAVLGLSQNKDIENRSKLDTQVFKVAEKYAYVPLEDINIGLFLGDLLRLIIDNKLRISSDICLLLKALIGLDSTVRRIKPDFDMIGHIEPFVKRMIMERSSPMYIAKNVYSSLVQYSKVLQELPASLNDIVDQVRRKNFRLQVEPRGLDQFMTRNDQISNRISYSIVTASMLVSSSLIMHAGIPPAINGISVIGMMTFLFSLLMGSFLLISILRHGRM